VGFLAADDFAVVVRFVADFFAAFFAGDFAPADAFFAGLREAVFFGRVGAIGSLPLDYQMYQMRATVVQLSSLRRRVSMVGCLIVPNSIFWTAR
jgi:hypothetical protein